MTPERMFAAAAATWPPAAVHAVGHWTIRQGGGGGSRVSCATTDAAPDATRIAQAEAAMRALGQVPLVMVRQGQDGLDAALARRGYALKDPVIAWAAPVATLARLRPPPVTTFEVWPPLAAQAEVWAAGGIGPARLAVMARARGAKVALLGRQDEVPVGAAFVACDGDVAMLHALEVLEPARRQGLGRHLLTAAAFWAARQGAAHLGLLVTRANVAANRLYASAGMVAVAQYHYRILPE